VGSAGHSKNWDSRRLGALAGLITPPLFAGVILAQDWLRSDFDPMRQFISELAFGPLGWVQNVNFLLHGALFVVFARGVAAALAGHAMARTGSWLLGIVGVCIFMSGLFVTDPRGQTTWHGTLHLLFGALLFTLMPIASLLFHLHLRRDASWSRLATLSLLTALVDGMAWAIIVPGSFVAPMVGLFSSRIGLINRIAVGFWLVWQFSFASALRRRAAVERPHSAARAVVR
jgi:Protein of unknown function (DUF998)